MATQLRGLAVALGILAGAPIMMDAGQAQTAKNKMDAPALAKFVDREINARLNEEGLKPSPLSDDGEFLRRVYLDLVGVIPPADKVVAFLDSTDPNKRAKVIDELLDHSRFGTYLGEVWAGLLLPREANNRRLNHKPMQNWLADAFKNNKPMDKLVYDLLTAVGTQEANGAASYFILNPTADKLTDNVTQMFLGVRLQCAQCHNHPFVAIKQNEYWGMAAFFTKTRLSANPKQAAKKGAQVSVFESAAPPKGKGKKSNLPQGAKIVPAKFLQGEQPKLNPQEPYRPVLAKWITSPSNPFFAKAMVNRAWHQLFGRGIVNPVDDMHEGNVPSHPELLVQLTEQFKANHFDLKYLYRTICNSQAYQRTSRPVGENKGDKEYYSHAGVRGLSPEQLYDSLTAVVGNPGKGFKGPKGGKGLPATPRDAFLNFFRIDEGANPLEYQAGIPQALRLMNSPQLAVSPALNRILSETKDPAQVLEKLFLVTLSRRPTSQETQRYTEYVGRQADLRTGFTDILWALVNSSEFGLNH